MTDLSLPIEYFKKESKHLHRQVQDKEPSAVARVDRVLKNQTEISLMRAQHVIAVEYGFDKWDSLIKASAVELHLVITMAKIPELNDFGIGLYDGNKRLPKEERDAIFLKDRKVLRTSVERVRDTISWLKANVRPIKTLNSGRSSYGIKHVAEKDIGYITNGVFIAAAVIAGFPYKIRWDSPNVQFGMSEKSFKDITRRRHERKSQTVSQAELS